MVIKIKLKRPPLWGVFLNKIKFETLNQYEQQTINKRIQNEKSNGNKRKTKTEILPIIGGLMIGFAVVDFAMSFMGVNLTSFLGSASRFSPIVFGLIGSLLNSK